MAGPTAFGSGCQQVTQTNVCESAAHHNFVVTASRAIGIEVMRLDALGLQVLGSWTIQGDSAGG